MTALPSPEPCQVHFDPLNKQTSITKGKTLLEAAQHAGVELAAVCGGTGTCGTCRVRVVSGDTSALTIDEESEFTQEDIQAGYRLACQAEALSDVHVDVPPDSLVTAQRLQLEGEAIDLIPAPAVLPVDVTLPRPDLKDQRADMSRLSDALAEAGIPEAEVDYQGLKHFSERLRAQDWQARLAVRGRKVVGVLPPRSQLFGLAVDIGTTKIATYLLDLVNGLTAAKSGVMNPQIGYGEDIISRIAYSNRHENGLETLQQALINAINLALEKHCAQTGIQTEQVVDAVVVGNTIMQHLFAGLSVRQLGEVPFVPVVNEALELHAVDIGLKIAPGGFVFIPPNIAGYVGGDHISMLLATGAKSSHRTTIALDIGTNTEISLFHEGKHWCCSCASGPAFEGAHIRDGMRAVAGAIERVSIDGDKIQLHVVDGKPPVGICGSGVLDAVAQMLNAGILDRNGRFVGDHRRSRRRENQSEFILSPAALSGHGRDVVVTRKDVNEIQLAKGAIRSALDILMAEAGIQPGDVDEFIIAGAFGTYLDLQSAMRIKMLPDLPLKTFRQVGNAAGSGARMMLASIHYRDLATKIRQGVEYIELTTHPSFTDSYVDSLAM